VLVDVEEEVDEGREIHDGALRRDRAFVEPAIVLGPRGQPRTIVLGPRGQPRTIASRSARGARMLRAP
jgi:hypothetical protein